ncbi:MAG TPA: glycosyltransferase family 4 protein [Pyrinomonadaceae bacterium]
MTSSDMNEESKKPIRILIVAPSFDILGGQTVQAARLVERLRGEPGIEVGFLPINPRLPGILRRIQAIKYVRTLVTSLAYVASLITRVRQYDIIHIFSASYFSFILAPTPAILIGKLYGKRLLLNYHSGEAEDHLQRWRRTAIPTIKMVDELIVPSAYLVRVFAQFGLQAKPIYNLIETEKFCFRDRRPLRPIFLSNRNFEIHYGIDRVLRAFHIIQARFPDARLIVAGDGPQRSALQQLAQELNLKNVEFMGRVDHDKVAELYDSADIWLNGSEIDNQPLSVLEAFACGLAIVTTDAGGIPDMVTHGSTALIVARGDYEAMANAATRLLDQQDFAEKMIAAGREECRKYLWKTVRGEWLSVYGCLADQNFESAPMASEIEPAIGQSRDKIPDSS